MNSALIPESVKKRWMGIQEMWPYVVTYGSLIKHDDNSEGLNYLFEKILSKMEQNRELKKHIRELDRHVEALESLLENKKFELNVVE